MSQSPDGDASRSSAEELLRYRSAWSALNQLIGKGSSFSGHERNCCFLNTGRTVGDSRRFADVSAASGLDLEDDGRAVAVCDWDFDGDLDLWLANRTAPRVRFMRNDTRNGHHWLALRLEGVSCNRDAIGARVEVSLAGDTGRRIGTLRAGDAYLSQSSKWLHFGLGASTAIERVVVSWPGGRDETFSELRADRHYLLAQGSGRAVEWTPPATREPLDPAPVRLPPAEAATRTVISGRVPLPESHYESWDGKAAPLDRHRGGALLLSLWSRSCAPCLQELKEWSEHAEALREAGLDILALDVDGLSPPKTAGHSEARDLLARLRFPFSSGVATAGLVTNLELVHRAYVELQRPLPVPSSFLLDEDGRVAAIYKGRVGLEDLRTDVGLLNATAEKRRDSAVPFRGRWASRTFPSDPGPIVRGLELSGDLEAAARYLRRYVASTARSLDRSAAPAPEQAAPIVSAVQRVGERLLSEGKAEAAGRVYEELRTVAPRDSALHRRIGVRLLLKGRLHEATAHFSLALEGEPENPELLYNFGLAELGLRRTKAAVNHLREALEYRPDDPATHFHLANALLAEDDAPSALRHLRRALELRPGWPYAANNLAWVLSTHPDDSLRDGVEAVRVAEELTRKDGGRNHATLATLAAAYAEAGRFREALATNQRALDLAQQKGLDDSVAQLRERHALYRAGHPFRAGTD